MSGRRRQTLSPSLFPFLAVLVCTLGTLILLLALVAQNTSDAAQQIAESSADDRLNDPAALTVGDVELLVEEEAFRLSELISFREAQTGDLEERRNQLAHVEDHMRRIRERLQQISQAMEQAMSQSEAPAATTEELKALKEQLVKEDLVVKRLREDIQTAKPRFVIVPHQGPNGTNRRPIYLECTDKGVTIWPEGVAITLWQLENSSSDANPLDDALRAARYHAMQEYGDSIPPYPMLLVRPDGVDTYYAARAAMMDWDDQFGYEMVAAEIDLAYPKPDPAMRQRLQYAINNATERVSRQSVARSIRGPGSRNPGVPGSSRGNVERHAGSTGGVADSTGAAPYSSGVVEPSPVEKMPRLSVSQMDRLGRQSGYRDHRMYPLSSYGQSGSGVGGSPITSEAAKRRLERQLQDSASSLADVDADHALDQAATTAVDQIAGTTKNGTSGQQPAGDPSSTWPMASSGESSDSSLAMSPPGDSDVGTGRLLSPQSNSPAQEGPAGVGTFGRPMASIHPQGQHDVSQRMPADASSGADGATTATANQRPSDQQANNGAALVQRSGVDWALPSSVATSRGNEIVRPIRMQIHADRMVLLPDATSHASESFEIDPGGINQATLQVATSVRNRIERWGTAAPGARWSPLLKVEVMWGAEQRFAQFERMMTGSGLSIQRSGYSQAESGGRGDLR